MSAEDPDRMSSLKEQLRSAGVVLADAGLSPGTTGNMSVHLDGRIFVTASGVRLADVGELAEIDPAGVHVAGPRATKEVPMHLAVYVTQPRWRAAIHLHSTYATLRSTMAGLDEQDAIPALTPYLTMRAGRVAVIPYDRPGSPDIGRNVAERIRTGSSALLLRNHGSLVVGESVDEALALAFELEESAKLAVLGHGLPLVPLSPAQRGELRA